MTQDPSKTPDPNQPQSVGDALPDQALASNATPLDSALEPDAVAVSTDEVAEEVEEIVEEVLLEAGTLEVEEEAEEEAEVIQAAMHESSNPSRNPKAAATKATTATKPTGKFQAFLRLIGQLWGIVVAGLPILISLLRTIGRFVLKVLQGLWDLWRGILPKLRTILPARLSQFPDWVLTTIAFSLVILVLWLFTLLLPARTPSVAQTEPIPPKLVAPAPVPDPDQIARLQNQVAEVTNQYAEGLIEAVQANLQRGRLMVQVGDGWYTLEPSYQDKVANEILKRSRRLDFTKLEITDSEGTLVARNPVVGSEMVVYSRTREEG